MPPRPTRPRRDPPAAAGPASRSQRRRQPWRARGPGCLRVPRAAARAAASSGAGRAARFPAGRLASRAAAWPARGAAGGVRGGPACTAQRGAFPCARRHSRGRDGRDCRRRRCPDYRAAASSCAGQRGPRGRPAGCHGSRSGRPVATAAARSWPAPGGRDPAGRAAADVGWPARCARAAAIVGSRADHVGGFVPDRHVAGTCAQPVTRADRQRLPRAARHPRLPVERDCSASIRNREAPATGPRLA